jgi:ABC-type bacteriocin/lantibiotic exporter with double-glycine peptidase domain
LENITYHYSDTLEPAIKNISLTIKKGQSIALIGKSGSGKTTLVDIILGLLKIESGDIWVDGVSIYSNLRCWQNLIGYIPQSIFLIDDTIERNIAFGVPDHLIDYEKLDKAIQAAQLTELIEQLPNGIKTSVGERGVRLSGGQRQRVGIARALYHDREILVLDEATAALDNETESMVSESIRALSGTKTMIIIAHRLTTVKHCDRVYMLEKGCIVKSGSYQEVVGEQAFH